MSKQNFHLKEVGSRQATKFLDVSANCALGEKVTAARNLGIIRSILGVSQIAPQDDFGYISEFG